MSPLSLLQYTIQHSTFAEPLRDYGPVYAETDLTRFIVEPWNGFSSLAFLIPAAYWLYKFRGQYLKKGFYVYCAILLTLGGVGSTIYHLFRYYPFFIFMDFVPILILTFSVAAYLWNLLLKNPYKVGLITIIVFLLRYINHQLPIDAHTMINTDYFTTGVFFFLPALILILKYQFYGLSLFSLSLLCLVLALACRIIDVRMHFELMPMGTHFLWHLFCAAGAFFLGEFIIKFRIYLNEKKEFDESD